MLQVHHLKQMNKASHVQTCRLRSQFQMEAWTASISRESGTHCSTCPCFVKCGLAHCTIMLRQGILPVVRTATLMPMILPTWAEAHAVAPGGILVLSFRFCKYTAASGVAEKVPGSATKMTVVVGPLGSLKGQALRGR
jgi:hypothetical protein